MMNDADTVPFSFLDIIYEIIDRTLEDRRSFLICIFRRRV